MVSTQRKNGGKGTYLRLNRLAGGESRLRGGLGLLSRFLLGPLQEGSLIGCEDTVGANNRTEGVGQEEGNDE